MAVSPALEVVSSPIGIWGRIAIGAASLLASVLLRGTYKNTGTVERQVQKGFTVRAPSTEGTIPIIYGRTRTNVSLADFRQSNLEPVANQGGYSIGTIYNIGNTVRHRGFVWTCLVNNTQNIEPNHTNINNWRQLASAGSGSDIVSSHGEYAGNETYSIGNTVRYEGIVWYCLVDGIMGITPSITTSAGKNNWQAMYAGRGNQIVSMVCPIAVGSQNGTGIERVRRVYFNDNIAIEGPTENNAPKYINVSSPWRDVRAPSNPGGIFGVSQWLAWGLHLGTSTQATDTELVNRFPGIWTDKHQGRNIAYLVLLLVFSREIYSSIPTITCEVDGQRVYDPRHPTDGINGDGFVWSDNPALCILDYLTSTEYGCEIPIGELDIASFISSANYYDTSVPAGGSTVSLHTMNGEVDTSLSRTENLLKMLTSCRGEIIEQGGKYRLFTKQTSGTSGVKINYSNIKDIVQVTRGGSGLVKNRIEVTYRDREDGYKARTVHWPPINSPGTPLVEDANSESIERIELPFTDNYYNALYIAQIRLAEQRQSEQVALITTRETFKAQVGSIIELDEPVLNYTDAKFWVSGMALTKEGRLAYALQEYNSGAYALDTLADRVALPGGANLYNINDPGEPENLRLKSDETTSVPVGDEDVKIDDIPAILARWDPPDDAFIDHYEIQYRKSTDLEWLLTGQRPGVNSPSVQIFPVEIGKTYIARVRCINVYSIPSDWIEEQIEVGGMQVNAIGNFRFERDGLALNLAPQYNIARSFKWLITVGTDMQPEPAAITKDMVVMKGACSASIEAILAHTYTANVARRIRVGVVFYRDDLCTSMAGELIQGIDTYDASDFVAVTVDSYSTNDSQNLLSRITITGIRIKPEAATLMFRYKVPAASSDWIKWAIFTTNLYKTSLNSDGDRVFAINVNRASQTGQASFVEFGVRIGDSGSPDSSVIVPLSSGIAPQDTVLIVTERPANSTAGVKGRLAVKFEDG